MNRKYLLLVEVTRIFLVWVIGTLAILYVSYVLPYLLGFWVQVGFWVVGLDIPVSVRVH